MKTRLASVLNRGAMLFASLLLCVASVPAQTVIAPPSASPGAAHAGGAAPTRSGGELAGIGSAYSPRMPLFKRQGIALRPHLQYRWLTVDELQLMPGQRVSTDVEEVSPGVLVELGQHWVLDYTASWITYSNEALDSTLDHAAGLSGSVTRGDWSFVLAQDYVSATSVLFETGQQTEGESYSTTFQTAYRASERTKIDLNLAHSVRNVSELTDSAETSIAGWLRREWTKRLSYAIGVSAGDVDVSPGSDMTYYRSQGQLTWQTTDKIFVNLEGGVENRSFRTGERDNLHSPIYGGSVEYYPFKTTKFVLAANRYVATSYFANAITRNEVVSGSLEQRLLRRLYFTARWAEYNMSHIATQRGVAIDRDDRRRILNLSLSLPFLQRGSASIFYQTGRNLSNETLFTFSSRQYGIELAYHF